MSDSTLFTDIAIFIIRPRAKGPGLVKSICIWISAIFDRHDARMNLIAVTNADR